MMDYKAIACLQQVIESQSFEKAGEVLGLTQSAVSQKIKKLELSYGAPLLLRDKPLSLTELGRRLIAHFVKVELMEHTLLAKEQSDALVQKLSIGINNDSLATWMMPALICFLQATKVRVQVKVADQSQTRRLLEKGDVVAGISDIGTPVTGGGSLFLGSLKYLLVATPSYVEKILKFDTSPKTLASSPALLFGEDDDLWARYQQEILGVKQDASQCHWLPSSEGFVKIVLSGTVCALIPSIQIEQELSDGSLVELSSGKFLSIPLYWHWYKLDSLALDKLTKFVRSEASIKLSS